MDKIIRCITSDGAVMASAIDASDIVLQPKNCTIFHAAAQPHSDVCFVQLQLWAQC